MPLACVDLYRVIVALGVVALKICKLLLPFTCRLVAIVGCILLSHVQGERQVAQSQW